MDDGAMDIQAAEPLDAAALARIDAWWRAANYLSVGQIYLYANPLLREPFAKEHVKPRLLGHWGTTPGLNFLYVHLNRIIRRTGLDVVFIAGPGHGGPAMVASNYLDGTYSEFYPDITQKWGLSFMINTEETPEGRSAGSLAWAGLANSYYWIDPAKNVTGVMATQLFPFGDPEAMGLFREFESAVYRSI